MYIWPVMITVIKKGKIERKGKDETLICKELIWMAEIVSVTTETIESGMVWHLM